MEDINNLTPTTYTKIIKGVKDHNNDIVDLKLIITKTNSTKINYNKQVANCKAEIFDSKNRYYCSAELGESYDTYLDWCINDKFHKLSYERYFENGQYEFDISGYDENNESIKRTQSKLGSVIYLDGGGWCDQFPLSEDKEKHLETIKILIVEAEKTLLGLKNKADELSKYYSIFVDDKILY